MRESEKHPSVCTIDVVLNVILLSTQSLYMYDASRTVSANREQMVATGGMNIPLLHVLSVWHETKLIDMFKAGGWNRVVLQPFTHPWMNPFQMKILFSSCHQQELFLPVFKTLVASSQSWIWIQTLTKAHRHPTSWVSDPLIGRVILYYTVLAMWWACFAWSQTSSHPLIFPYNNFSLFLMAIEISVSSL